VNEINGYLETMIEALDLPADYVDTVINLVIGVLKGDTSLQSAFSEFQTATFKMVKDKVAQTVTDSQVIHSVIVQTIDEICSSANTVSEAYSMII